MKPADLLGSSNWAIQILPFSHANVGLSYEQLCKMRFETILGFMARQQSLKEP